jgi:cholinesterase
LNVYAPSNVKEHSGLPVFFFIQGGGFNTNSNPNLNGSGIVLAGDKKVIVVNINYRVGAYGFLAASEVESPNNGLKDQRKALEWVQYCNLNTTQGANRSTGPKTHSSGKQI